MSNFDWTQYLVGGAAARPDSISHLDPGFQGSLAAMFSGAPEDIRPHLRVTSGFRSPDVQQKLWNDALAKYGSESAARKWVAPPGRSKHNHGQAVDLKYLAPAAQKWVLDNAQQFGRALPMAHEPWHIEPIGARGQAAPPAAPGGAGGLSYGAAQPSMPAPSAASLADMFAPPDQGLAVAMPARQAPDRRQMAAEREQIEQQRRQALLSDVGSFFG